MTQWLIHILEMLRSIEQALLEHTSHQTTLIITRWPLHVFKMYLWQSAAKGLLELELAFRTLFSKATNDLNFCEFVLCILKPFILLAFVKFCGNEFPIQIDSYEKCNSYCKCATQWFCRGSFPFLPCTLRNNKCPSP